MTTVETASDRTDESRTARERGTYAAPNEWVEARRRLQLLETVYDRATTRRLEATGVGAGWHCAEVGAGGGSVTRWLCDRVGPSGRVLAVDIDTRFVDELDHPSLEVRRQDIVTQPLRAGEFDLVHARAVLMHLPALLQSAGLDAVVADTDIRFFPGGSAGAEFIAVSCAQLRAALLAGGFPQQDLDDCLALLDDPTTWFPPMAIVGASGRRPA